mmetsp:Transcript_54651/g.59290  ORF Transcript_54651/g.59290 Transcript_54651/m.59290 type:complete len:201 (+) Transcript_54651:85-687(+)
MIGISQQQQQMSNQQHSPAAVAQQKQFSILRKVRSQLSFQTNQKKSSPPMLTRQGRKNQRQQEFDEDSKIDEGSRHQSAPLTLAPLTLTGGGNDDDEEEVVPMAAATRMKKSVSFSSFNSMKRVPSLVDLLETSKKDEIWYERTDFSCFAQEEMSRRFSLGITSTSALDSSVPETNSDDDDDDISSSDDDSTDDENGMTF